MIDSPRTTLVVAVVQSGSATWIHCGDSRLYMVRGGELLTRTRDHSYLELRNMPAGLERINRNVLFTCLGSPTKPIYDMTGPVHLEQGTASCCVPTGCRAPSATRKSVSSWAVRPSRRPCPSWRKRPCARLATAVTT